MGTGFEPRWENHHSLRNAGDSACESLLEFPLPESVKLEICRLLQNLCDLQLRNRVEQVVRFASKFVRALQEVS
ncbi:unnamed protein product [Trichobilharzia regenti]|nr:unnamed protein product [Trichobilharzia regenti]